MAASQVVRSAPTHHRLGQASREFKQRSSATTMPALARELMDADVIYVTLRMLTCT